MNHIDENDFVKATIAIYRERFRKWPESENSELIKDSVSAALELCEAMDKAIEKELNV